MITQNEIGFIALKFAVLEGDAQVVLLDQFAARVLYKLIETVSELDWKSDSLMPPNAGK
ncbi:MAG: hypothetical protein JWM91_2548 [Rhodospirillales bacterium]|nr:hypothetical protein [Rhodospirillales bacterium]